MGFYQIIYLIIVIGTILQRLWELKISASHEKWLRAEGGVEFFPEHFIYMKIVHILWLFCCLAPALYLDRKFENYYLIFMALYFFGQYLRYVAIKDLGKRWCVKIIILQNKEKVKNGIYKYLNHRNYCGVIIEIFALPLIFGLWEVALIFSILNGIILYIRIPRENEALGTICNS